MLADHSQPRLQGDWFLEEEGFGYTQGMRVKERLFKGETLFQRMEIFDSDYFGRCLVLDGALQTTELDEFMYHEMLVHTPLITHPSPHDVMIIGGGDGGALRRVLEHPETRPTQVEIDAAVIENCKQFIPSISAGAYDHPRANVVIGDGFEYMRNNQGRFDVVLVDSTDPVGPAVPLFESPFYRDIYRALSDDGLMAAQSNSPVYMLKELKTQLQNLREVFPIVRTYLGAVPAYPGGIWSYTIASKRYDPQLMTVDEVARRLSERGIQGRYYNPAVHVAAFALPNFVREAVAD